MLFSQAALNATLNGTSAILLAAGYAAIRTGKREAHKRFMISAFVVSCAFLVSYLVYHYRVGHVAFAGQGWIRPFYFVLLTSHTILAIVIVPLILITLRRAWTEKFDKHRAIAKWTLPLWFYVSVTGVIVYVMVYQLYRPVTRIRDERTAAAPQRIKVDPIYHNEAKDRSPSSIVRLHANIAKDGSVESLEVISGDPKFVPTAMDTVRKWHYRPTILNGEPVEVETTIEVLLDF
jgi:putative membrane protein